MKRSKFISTLLVLVGLAMIMTTGFSVYAANSAGQTVTFTNQAAADIQITAGGASHDFALIPTPGVAVDATSVATVTGTANTVFTITLTGTAFTDTGAVHSIPIDNCFKAKGGDLAALTALGAGKAVASAHAIGTAAVVMDYQLNVPWSAPVGVGAYTATLTYTMS